MHFTEEEAKAKVGKRVYIKDASDFQILPRGLKGTVKLTGICPKGRAKGQWTLCVQWDDFFAKRVDDTGTAYIRGRTDGFDKGDYGRYLAELEPETAMTTA